MKICFERLSKISGKSFDNELLIGLYYAFSEKDHLEEVLLHIKSITELTESIFNQKYPNELDPSKLNKNTAQGRPFDESAPQDEIKEFIKELINKALNEDPKFNRYRKYWHFTGKYEGKPNKNQILSKLKEEGLTGHLKDETIKDRIKKAVTSLGY